MTRNLSEPAPDAFRVPEPAEKSIDWSAEKDHIDLAAVITREIGGPRTRNDRPWWKCPFHDDARPSLIARKLDDGRQRWKCYGCGLRGDVAAFVMRLKSLNFPEAVEYLTGGKLTPGKAKSAPPTRQTKPKAVATPQPEGWQEAALAAVEAAECRLWTPEGSEALEYLYGRGLTEATIRNARLGFIRVRRTGVPSGVTIPWFDGPHLTMVNVRRPPGSDPKYRAFEGSRRGGIYPGPGSVKPGVPLVIVEGEFDCLLLGQELAGLASVVTLGSASDQADRRVTSAFLTAPRWYAANDADGAGDKAAGPWLAYDRCRRRVRPPGPHKDWTEAAAGGVNLRRWWSDILAGAERPPLFTWEELSTWRWGPGLTDAGPGIIVVRPGAGQTTVAPSAAPDDPDERSTIQSGDDLPIPSGPDEELGGFLGRLNGRGVRFDGVLVHPRINVGTVTGRLIYISPALQTLPKPDRLRRIGPVVTDRILIRADYGQIEPRVLLSILRRRGLISWEAGEDLYRDLIADTSVDRDAAKTFVNRAINGGRLEPVSAGRLAEFIGATEAYRASLAAEAMGRGYVETLAGRRIPLAADETNHGGKAVNRVVQGTAADVFNRAAVAVDGAISGQRLAASVAFLLYDELWVETDPAEARTGPLVRAGMEAAARADGVFVPVRFDEIVTEETLAGGSTRPAGGTADADAPIRSKP